MFPPSALSIRHHAYQLPAALAMAAETGGADDPDTEADDSSAAPEASEDAEENAEDSTEDTTAAEVEVVSEKDTLKARINELTIKVAGLQSEVNSLTKEANVDPKEQLMRVAADFENSRQQHRTKVERQREFTLVDTIGYLAPIIDAFEATNAQMDPQTEEGKTVLGLYMGVHKQLGQVISKDFGAEVVQAAVGDAFNPLDHEKSEEVESEEPEGSILEVLSTGLKVGPRVAKKARVKVAMSPSKEEAPSEEKSE